MPSPRNLIQLLSAPEDAGGGGGPVNTPEQIYDFLSGDDEVTEPEVEETEEDDNEPKDDDSEETETEETEPEPTNDDDINEIIFSDSVPKRAVILKEFPELYNKFPGLEKAVYREQKYAEFFPTINDAKEAQKTVASYNDLTRAIQDGSLSPVLRQVKESNEENYGKVVNNLLSDLYQTDQKSYNDVLTRVLKGTLVNAMNYGKQGGDDQIQIAAQLLHKFLFNSPEVTPYQDQTQQDQGLSQKEKELREKQINFYKEQMNSAVNDVSTRVKNVIRSQFERAIDPKSQMTDYVRSKAIDDAINQTDIAIKADSRFRSTMDALWKKAMQNGYSEASKLDIRNAFLAKAKSVQAGIIQRIRAEALKGQIRPRKSTKELVHDETPSSKKSSSNGKKTEIPKGMRTIDFLNMD